MSVALVTGGAKRLGREMVLTLARAGYDVAVHYHGSHEEASQTADEARAIGVAAGTFETDLLDPDAVEKLLPDVTAQMGQVSVLINNASVFERDDIHSATQDSWQRHIGSNLRAPFFLTQAFARQAPKADRSGEEPVATSLVVNMVDQRVLKPTPEFITYSIAKAALWEMTRMLAQALAPDIRVNAIGPGPTLQGARQSADEFAAQRASTILNRGADPDDIARTLLYLLSAKSVTGQLFCVDGGQHLAWQTPDIMGPE
ncbi:SDR family oxidoreductase [Paracoccus aerodenitrificans]|uniref:SDR family oxidoreductase n=1 Tax=Paracoccus aerodenitrificans TaxID=3017781 RepID=UPI0022F0398B|nr:SDR family oxidoreductase [Paracoccus aerodenitrificans]WBU63331.1 SDR family oxidoreductase [Paracoccus aerodenitrificans]